MECRAAQTICVSISSTTIPDSSLTNLVIAAKFMATKAKRFARVLNLLTNHPLLIRKKAKTRVQKTVVSQILMIKISTRAMGSSS